VASSPIGIDGTISTSEWRVAAGLSLVCVTALLAATPRLTPDNPGFAIPGDHHKYIYMAERGASGFHIAPFCWRIGVPALVRWMPWGRPFGFLLLTCVGVWAAGVGVYAAARAFGHDVPTGLFALLLFFTMGWGARFAVFDFWLPDGMVFAIVVWAIFYARCNRPLAFVMLTCIGALVKESVLFVTPLFATIAPSASNGAGVVARRLALVLPAVAVWLVVRAAIPAYNGDGAYVASLPANVRAADDAITSYSYLERARAIGARRLHQFNGSTLHAASTEPFGMAPCLLGLVAWRRNLALLARMWPFVLMVYAQLFFATDTQRLVMLAFPVVLLMACNGLEELRRRLRAAPSSWILLGVFLFVAMLWHRQKWTSGVGVQMIILAGYAGGVALIARRTRLRIS
jgi:hypothetical protein